MARDNEHHDDDDDDDSGNALERGLSKAAERLEGGRGRAAADDDADDRDDADDQDDRDDDDDAPDDDDQDDAPDDDEEEEDDEDDEDEEDDADSPDDDDEDEEEDEDDDDELDPEVEAAAARHQLPTNFEDVIKTLPKEARAAARQAFHQRLKDVESGLGRAFQEARAERQELARVRLERKAIADNPIDHIVELLESEPKLLDQLNEELENRENPRYRAAKEKERTNAKKDLDSQVEAATRQAEERRQRGTQVVALAQRLARDAGVPFKLIDKALYIAVTSSKDGDISDAVIRRIVKQEARDWQKLTGERKRASKQEYIRSKSKQVKDAKRRPSARDRGHAPAPGRRREPKSLEEALTRAASRILPDAPA